MLGSVRVCLLEVMTRAKIWGVFFLNFWFLSYDTFLFIYLGEKCWTKKWIKSYIVQTILESQPSIVV